ncbi:replication/maintenance protein RepL [Escherichia coli]
MSATIENDESLPSTPANNHNFVQVSRAYLKAWRGLIRKSGLAAEILFYLVERMGKTTNAVVCSYATLTEVTGYSRRSVATAIKILKEDNWIQVVKIGNASAYCVNEKVIWQAGRNQRKYAIFSATVVASESEQESDYHLKAKEKLTYIPFVERTERMVIGGEELPPPDQKDLDLS